MRSALAAVLAEAAEVCADLAVDFAAVLAED